MKKLNEQERLKVKNRTIGEETEMEAEYSILPSIH